MPLDPLSTNPLSLFCPDDFVQRFELLEKNEASMKRKSQPFSLSVLLSLDRVACRARRGYGCCRAADVLALGAFDYAHDLIHEWSLVYSSRSIVMS